MDEVKLFYIKLKETRESAGHTLEEISDYTKIDIRYLIAIEKGDFTCLPNVYMRLFLRSYCRYIGVDETETLNAYEFHTLGTIAKESKKISAASNNDDATLASESTDALNLPQISSAKLKTIIGTIAIIILIFLLIGSLTKKDESQLPISSSLEDEEIMNPDDLIGVYTPIPNNRLLSNYEFQSSNMIVEQSAILPDLPPYIFTFLALTQTKINVDNDGEITNKIMDADQILKFTTNKEIRFDVWNTNHMNIFLNGTLVNKFFKKDNQSLRGSFQTENQSLYYKLYKQVTY